MYGLGIICTIKRIFEKFCFFFSESKRRKLSASIFDTAPDLNVPMDIFDPEDEEDESGNPGFNRMTHFDAETPDQTIGQSVRSAFDVTDFQVCSFFSVKFGTWAGTRVFL